MQCVEEKSGGVVRCLKCQFGFIPLFFGSGQNVKVNTVVILGACFILIYLNVGRGNPFKKSIISKFK